MEESHGDHGISIPDSPIDHLESVYVTLEIEETLNAQAFIAVSRIETALDSFHFSDPSELALSIPYPTTIVEDATSLCCHNIHAK